MSCERQKERPEFCRGRAGLCVSVLRCVGTQSAGMTHKRPSIHQGAKVCHRPNLKKKV